MLSNIKQTIPLEGERAEGGGRVERKVRGGALGKGAGSFGRGMGFRFPKTEAVIVSYTKIKTPKFDGRSYVTP